MLGEARVGSAVREKIITVAFEVGDDRGDLGLNFTDVLAGWQFTFGEDALDLELLDLLDCNVEHFFELPLDNLLLDELVFDEVGSALLGGGLGGDKAITEDFCGGLLLGVEFLAAGLFDGVKLVHLVLGEEFDLLDHVRLSCCEAG